MSARTCPTCRQPCGWDEEEGDRVDPCLGILFGVWVACCGHGVRELGLDDEGRLVATDTCYVGFRGGPTLYGNAARAAMEMLGGQPPPAPPVYWPAVPEESPDLAERVARRG